MIALTFDDGPGPRTSELLNQLKKYNAHATFFMLGKNVKLYPDAVKQMLKDGNELGNHSYDHQQLTKIDGAAVKKEVDDTNRNIKNICGSPATLLRPPYGAINDTVKSNVGMPMILWNVDTLDWKTRNTQSTIDSVMKNLKDGDIVLMHDIHSQTIDAALELIPKLEEEGYQLVTVSEMAAAKKQDLKDGTAYSDFTNINKRTCQLAGIFCYHSMQPVEVDPGGKFVYIFTKYRMCLLKKTVNLLSWIHNFSDTDVMIHRIDDQCNEFTHVCDQEIRLFLCFGRKISKIGSDHTVDISFFIIFIEFLKSVGKKSECSADKYAVCSTVFNLFCNIEHTFTGRNHIINDDRIFSIKMFT